VTTTAEVLDREWRELCDSPAAAEALDRWRSECRVMAGLTRLGDVLELPRHDGTEAEALATLARLAPTDVVAARTLLQALLRGLICLAGRCADLGPATLDEVVGISWERIRTYPPTRTGSVAANVLRDVRKRLLADRRAARPVPALAVRSSAPSAEDQAIGSLAAADDVRAMVRLGVIAACDAELIVRTRLLGRSVVEEARARGADVDCLTQRRWRAERRMGLWLRPNAA
jgi:hypothetical protein